MYKWNSLLHFHMYMPLYIVLTVLFPHCPPVCLIPFVPTESLSCAYVPFLFSSDSLPSSMTYTQIGNTHACTHACTHTFKPSFTYERKYVLLFLSLAYLLNSVILRSIHFAQMSSFCVWKHSIEYMCHVLVFCSCVGGHFCWSSSIAPVRGAAAGTAVCTFVVHWHRGFPVQTKREVSTWVLHLT